MVKIENELRCKYYTLYKQGDIRELLQPPVSDNIHPTRDEMTESRKIGKLGYSNKRTCVFQPTVSCHSIPMKIQKNQHLLASSQGIDAVTPIRNYRYI